MLQRRASGCRVKALRKRLLVDLYQNCSPQLLVLRLQMSRVSKMASKLLALVYDDGIVLDRIISQLGYELRDLGLSVRGLVQRNTFKRDSLKCDMELEELGTGQIFQLSEDRGKRVGGCRLDRHAIVKAANVIEQSLDTRCDLLIINKFGRTEAEGRGLRDLIAEAVTRGIPTLVGVPRRNFEVWQVFAAGYSENCESKDVAALFSWVKSILNHAPSASGSRSVGNFLSEKNF